MSLTPAQKSRAQEILQRFVGSVETLVAQPERLDHALHLGLNSVLNDLLRTACEEEGLQTELLVEFLDADTQAHEALQSRLGEVLSGPNVAGAQARAARRDVTRHLNVMRYLLSGAPLPDWVEGTLDAEEREKLHLAREDSEPDPALLARVERALARAHDTQMFGRCEGCGEDIPAQRLQLVPYAECCAACERAREEGEVPARPLGVDVIRF